MWEMAHNLDRSLAQAHWKISMTQIIMNVGPSEVLFLSSVYFSFQLRKKLQVRIFLLPFLICQFLIVKST